MTTDRETDRLAQLRADIELHADAPRAIEQLGPLLTTPPPPAKWWLETVDGFEWAESEQQAVEALNGWLGEAWAAAMASGEWDVVDGWRMGYAVTTRVVRAVDGEDGTDYGLVSVATETDLLARAERAEQMSIEARSDLHVAERERDRWEREAAESDRLHATTLAELRKVRERLAAETARRERAERERDALLTAAPQTKGPLGTGRSPSEEDFRARVVSLRAMAPAAGCMPLDVGCLDKAVALAEILAGRRLPWPFVYPTCEGGTSLEWDAGDWYIDVEVNPGQPWRGDATNTKTEESTDFETEFDGCEAAALSLFAAAGISYASQAPPAEGPREPTTAPPMIPTDPDDERSVDRLVRERSRSATGRRRAIADSDRHPYARERHLAAILERIAEGAPDPARLARRALAVEASIAGPTPSDGPSNDDLTTWPQVEGVVNLGGGWVYNPGCPECDGGYISTGLCTCVRWAGGPTPSTGEAPTEEWTADELEIIGRAAAGNAWIRSRGGLSDGTGEALTRCVAARDGECMHPDCPQVRDGEPHATGRHCPLDNDEADR